MDVFGVRDQLIDDYSAFTTAFVDINDPRIKEYVDDQLSRGDQWPEPWISLNPMFQSGGAVGDLVSEGLPPTAPSPRAGDVVPVRFSRSRRLAGSPTPRCGARCSARKPSTQSGSPPRQSKWRPGHRQAAAGRGCRVTPRRWIGGTPRASVPNLSESLTKSHTWESKASSAMRVSCRR